MWGLGQKERLIVAEDMVDQVLNGRLRCVLTSVLWSPIVVQISKRLLSWINPFSWCGGNIPGCFWGEACYDGSGYRLWCNTHQISRRKNDFNVGREKTALALSIWFKTMAFLF